MAKTKRMRMWKFPENASVAAVVLREIDGHDELEAARMARTKQALTEAEAVAHLTEEQIRLAIVAVQPRGGDRPVEVKQPYEDFDTWSTVTRMLTHSAFSELNEISRQDMAAFHASAEEWVETAPASNETPSGEYEKPKAAKPARPASTPSRSPAAP